MGSQPCTDPGRLLPLDKVGTPAIVYDQVKLEALLARGETIRELAGVKVLYAVKAAALLPLLQRFSQRLDGFAVSSSFESRLVRDLFPWAKTHFTSPAIRPDEIPELRAHCDYVSFNSRMQAEMCGDALANTTSLGVRVNTGLSNVSGRSI